MASTFILDDKPCLFLRLIGRNSANAIITSTHFLFRVCYPTIQELRIAEFLRLKGLKFKRFKVDELKRARLDLFVNTHLNAEAKEIFRPLYLKIFIFSS